ncbi:MAG: SHOCT domain-containing protein [Fimbriimonas sp.]|nr:SHOCT domain-containing protein [Fimbriimonas sp.]
MNLLKILMVVFTVGPIGFLAWYYFRGPRKSLEAPSEARLDFIAAAFERLADMHRNGQMTDEEFEEAKKKVMESQAALK